MNVVREVSAPRRLRCGRNVLFTLCLMVEVVFVRVTPGLALEQVSLQLKWKHQFQFAGYYAAIEKGFYRDNGLDVSVREGGPDIDAGLEVAKGAADFGVCTSSVLVNSAERANNVVLGVIFNTPRPSSWCRTAPAFMRSPS
jgi:ABC-type nitrate/sulfonate/bicarbonate transport system substrate-binding protein